MVSYFLIFVVVYYEVVRLGYYIYCDLVIFIFYKIIYLGLKLEKNKSWF